MTIDVSPFSKCGLSLPPDTAIPNPLLESCSLELGERKKKMKNPSISGFRDLLQALNKIKVKSITRDNLGTDGLTETKEKQNKVTVWSADRVLKGTCLSTGAALWEAEMIDSPGQHYHKRQEKEGCLLLNRTVLPKAR